MKLLIALILTFLVSSAFCQTLKATVTWDAYTAAEIATFSPTGYTVERKAEACAGTGAFAQIATVPMTASLLPTFTYDDTGITGPFPKTFCYRVAGVNATGKTYSNTTAKTFALSLPPAPRNLIVADVVVSYNPDTNQLEFKITQIQPLQ